MVSAKGSARNKSEILKTAEHYITLGFNTCPIGVKPHDPDEDRAKGCYLDGWSPGLRERKATLDDWNEWVESHWWIRGVGIVCGAPLAGIEVLDIEPLLVKSNRWPVLEGQIAKILGPHLLDQIVIRRSQRGGRHYIWKTNWPIEGCQLAKTDANEPKFSDDGSPLLDKSGQQVTCEQLLIEFLGVKKQVAVWLCNMEDGGYTILSGEMQSVALVPPEKRDAILELCRSFDQSGKVKARPVDQPKATPIERAPGDNLVGDDYNRRGIAHFRATLTSLGYDANKQQTEFRRPGKTNRTNATLKVRETNGDWQVTNFEGDYSLLPVNESQTLFAAYAAIVHGVDLYKASDPKWKDVVKELAGQGYGDKSKPKLKRSHTGNSNHSAAETEATASGWSLFVVANGKKHKVYAKVSDDVRHVDTFDIASARGRDSFLKGCQDSGATDDDIEQLRCDLLRIESEGIPEPDQSDEPVDELEATIQRELERTDPDIIAKAKRMLAGNALEWAANLISDYGIVGERDLVESLYLCYTSRLLRKPVSAIISSSSSSGKSYISDKVAELMPPESVVKAHDISPQALYYLEPGKLRHRIVLAGEKKRNQTEESQDATKAIREMIASGKLSKLVTISSQGRPQTVQIEQEGPICYIETTTLEPGEIFDEDLNRCWGLSCDESDQQTKNIILREAEKAAGLVVGDEEYVAKLSHTMQRLLKPRDVVIPFAPRLAGLIPKRESRRAFSRLISIIQASALLHQYGRETDEEGRIIATVEDYAIAFELYRPNLEDLLVNQLREKEAEKWDAIRNHPDIINLEFSGGWSANDVMAAMAGKPGFGNDSVYRLLNSLLSNGLIVRVESQSKAARYRKNRNANQITQELGLPTPSELDFWPERNDETPCSSPENRKVALSHCRETTCDSGGESDGFGKSEDRIGKSDLLSDFPMDSEMASET